MKKLTYRTCEYVNEYEQSFDYEEPEYKYNVFSKELEVVGKIDTFEQIQSHKDCALDNILERFMGDVTETDVDLSDFFNNSNLYEKDTRSDLEILQSYYEQVEELRQKFNISDYVDTADVYAVIQDNIKNSNAKKEEIENAKENEKTSVKETI